MAMGYLVTYYLTAKIGIDIHDTILHVYTIYLYVTYHLGCLLWLEEPGDS